MKVLFVAVRGFLERTAHFTYMLPNYLAKKGIEVTVFAPRQHTSYTTLEKGVTVETFDSYRIFPGLEVSPSLCSRLLRLKQKQDIIHATAYGALETFFAYRASKAHKVPLVITTDLAKRYFLEDSKNPLKRLYAGIFARPPMKAAHKIAFTEREKKMLEEKGYREIDVIPVGVKLYGLAKKPDKNKLRKKIGLPPDKRIILSVSHAPTKGTDYILDAAEMLPEVLFLLVGSINEKYRAHLEKRARKENIENVIITGAVESVKEYFLAADAYVCASIDESFGAARVEAVACGLPVITTDVGCKVPGIIIRKRDAKDIASKINTLLSNVELRHKLAKQKNWAKKFDWNSITEKTIELYQKLIKR